MFAVSQSARPTRLCPECRCIQDKNFDRHLNHHFDISTVEGRQQKRRVKAEATRRTVQGLREADPDLLPRVLKEALAKDTHAAHAFRNFLDNVGVILPHQQEAGRPQPTPRKRKFEEEHDDLEV